MWFILKAFFLPFFQHYFNTRNVVSLKLFHVYSWQLQLQTLNRSRNRKALPEIMWHQMYDSLRAQFANISLITVNSFIFSWKAFGFSSGDSTRILHIMTWICQELVIPYIQRYDQSLKINHWSTLFCGCTPSQTMDEYFRPGPENPESNFWVQMHWLETFSQIFHSINSCGLLWSSN